MNLSVRCDKIFHNTFFLLEVIRLRRFFTAMIICVLTAAFSACGLLYDPASTGLSDRGTENTAGLTYPVSEVTYPDIFHRYPSIMDVTENDIGIHPSGNTYNVVGDDGSVLVKVTVTLPTISFNSENAAELSVNKTLNKTKSEIERRIQRLADSVLSDRKNGYTPFGTSKFAASYTLTGFSSDYASILYSITEVNSDGQTNHTLICSVIDLKAGFAVDLSTLFTGGLSDKLISLVNEKLASCGKPLYRNYEALAANGIKNCWLIGSGDILIVFPPSMIAPATEGTVEIILKNNEINELMNEYGSTLLGDPPATAPDIDADEDN